MKWPKSLLSPVLAFLTACASPAAMAADNPPPSKPPVNDTTSAVQPHLITKNADGTLTIQKTPPKDAKAGHSGLIIPPQVIVPLATTPTPKKD